MLKWEKVRVFSLTNHLRNTQSEEISRIQTRLYVFTERVFPYFDILSAKSFE